MNFSRSKNKGVLKSEEIGKIKDSTVPILPKTRAVSYVLQSKLIFFELKEKLNSLIVSLLFLKKLASLKNLKSDIICTSFFILTIF